MSASKEATVWCDVDACATWHQASGSPTSVRASARVLGWSRVADKDLCPEHTSPTPSAADVRRKRRGADS